MVTFWHTVLATLTLNAPAMAQDAAQSASPPAAKRRASFISRIVMPKVPATHATNWSTLTYTDLADATDAAFAVKLNAGLAAAKQYGEHADPVRQMQRAADAGGVLRRVGETWELMRDVQGTTVSLGTAKGELPAGAAVRAILGYDAVVVSQQGNVVLAQTPDLSNNTELYAVSLGGSAASTTVGAETTLPRSALLRLIDSRKVAGHGSMSRFRMVSSESGEKLPFGTKLRLEPWQ